MSKCFSQNILHNVLNAVYRTTLNIRTARTDKTVKTQIRLLLEEQSDLRLHCLSFYLLHSHTILQGKPKLLNIRIFSTLISGVPIFRGFHLKMFVDSLREKKMITLGSYS